MTEMIRVSINGARNAYGGQRNAYEVIKVEEDSQLPTEINNQLNLGSYVLVKYAGKLYMCEKNEAGAYSRKAIEYHPHMDKFST